MKGAVVQGKGKLTVVRDESQTKNNVDGGLFFARCVSLSKVNISGSQLVTTGRCSPERLQGGSKFNHHIGNLESN